MKQAINQQLRVDFDFDLDDASKIEFMFRQRNVTREVEYPSDEAKRAPGENAVLVEWDPEETARFQPNMDVEMDTRITLTGSEYNPETDLTTFRIGRSLFKAGEIT